MVQSALNSTASANFCGIPKLSSDKQKAHVIELYASTSGTMLWEIKTQACSTWSQLPTWPAVLEGCMLLMDAPLPKILSYAMPMTLIGCPVFGTPRAIPDPLNGIPMRFSLFWPNSTFAAGAVSGVWAVCCCSCKGGLSLEGADLAFVSCPLPSCFKTLCTSANLTSNSGSSWLSGSALRGAADPSISSVSPSGLISQSWLIACEVWSCEASPIDASLICCCEPCCKGWVGCRGGCGVTESPGVCWRLLIWGFCSKRPLLGSSSLVLGRISAAATGAITSDTLLCSCDIECTGAGKWGAATTGCAGWAPAVDEDETVGKFELGLRLFGPMAVCRPLNSMFSPANQNENLANFALGFRPIVKASHALYQSINWLQWFM